MISKGSDFQLVVPSKQTFKCQENLELTVSHSPKNILNLNFSRLVNRTEDLWS